MHNIDILLATYNGEKYLKSQIESILSQTYARWKIIIHDDNSEDSTIEIIKEYAKKYPDKITFFDDNMSFSNASSNFNFLLAQSNAQYIMFCDQDDVWLPHKIEITMQEIKKLEVQHPTSALMVFTDLEVVDENLKVLAKSMWKQEKLNPDISQKLDNILALNVVSGCTIMLNFLGKKFISPIPKEHITHDHWIAINIAKYGHISYVNQTLIQYRQHPENTLGAHSHGFKYFIFKLTRLLQSPAHFLKKYSYFNFPLSTKRVLLQKFILNFKRLF